jgi:hypothetical protein
MVAGCPEDALRALLGHPLLLACTAEIMAPFLHGPQKYLAAFMTEPTDNQVVVKANQLALDDGRLWLWGSEDNQPRAARARIADDSLRAEYLNRALELLRHEKI